jgi:uncharacterized protein (DUF1499 family)
VESSNVNFKELKRPNKPNWYLVCDDKHCNINADEASVCFNASASTLKETVVEYINDQPRYRLLKSTKDNIQYVQKSFIFRFPDILTIQFYELEENKSTLAILSYAVYGYSDFGVNKKRVSDLVNHLKNNLSVCGLADGFAK